MDITEDSVTTYKLPLGIMRQGIMKMDSLLSDLNEIKSDEEVDPNDREIVHNMASTIATMEAVLLNMVRKECDEEEFLNENIEMDELDAFPSNDIVDDILEEMIN